MDNKLSSGSGIRIDYNKAEFTHRETEIDSYKDEVTQDWMPSPVRKQSSPRLPPSPAPRTSIEVKCQNVNSPLGVEVKGQNVNSPLRVEVSSKANDIPLLRQPPSPAPRTSIEVKGQSPQMSEIRRSPVKKVTENSVLDNKNEYSTPSKTTPGGSRQLPKERLTINVDSVKSEQIQHNLSSPMREKQSTDTPSKSNKVKGHGSPSTMRHPELPPVICDPKTGETYKRGRLLGKGGFARCYELVHMTTNRLFAGKIVPKARIAKPQQREKMDREISVHSKLRHPNVVSYHAHFEDDENIYIILELCSKKSLVQMLKLRHTFTEPEVRYFMQQIVEGVRYLHGHSVLHRDLKLGNMFLTDVMEVKIGDFGLAAKLEYEGDRKRTMCGTPNYIAPEVLGKIGHSFEADVWALGCIMYTMLVGRPPFETSSLKETYSRIKHNHYVLPDSLSPAARDLISKLLTSNPEERPSLEKIVHHEFFTTGFIPEALSPTVVTTAPKFPITKVLISDSKGDIVPKEICRLHRESTLQRRDTPAPLSTLRVNNNNSPSPKSPVLGRHSSSTPKSRSAKHLSTRTMTPVTSAIKNAMATVMDKKGVVTLKCTACPMSNVYDMLTTCLDHMPQAEYLCTPKYKPSSSELIWVIKWVDYSNKYGFGYQLSDRSVGVMFNDKSRICFTPNRRSVQYLSSEDKAHLFALNSVPARLSKKVTLLDYFSTYMDEHLIKGPVQDMAGSPTSPIGNKDGEVESVRSPPSKRKTHHQGSSPVQMQPYLECWNRSNRAIGMYLSNGTLQVNFFEDHTKVILSHNNNDPLVTYINEERHATTYRLIHIAHHGCSAPLYERLNYAQSVLLNMLGSANTNEKDESTNL